MKIKNWILCIAMAITLMSGFAFSATTQKAETKNPVMVFIEHGADD
ncbi:hypothetical protein ERICIV_00950 [Paenibacillus larvae subsp. larvae]|uniref:Uncharacterized protein n=1 Tax=Paenibacillus larvae subsp. larvae TaxID=147375 RepID=A0A2L1TWT1_9BACL|nr:hypothetical protein [Paenibacillus larvae]AVF25135.1 hypothetical protein ERICIII_00930 [Paenibacillus larvae subsp. larvae]AVF29911.1 hypothetical protein ERICIV_00950 [Paenibacillus larvae subsp. larvae]MCY9677732.1 hypothetical protein [Paenibacillus larvae]MCY9748186.1 hypothetical protein [Paenibacillus larvae]MDR5606575.1 hypothetical protein [Paenibacillus larvae]